MKKRPAVVIGSDTYHRHRADVVVMAVTSQASKSVVAAGDVLINEWKDAGLLKPSLIKPVLATLDRRLVLRRLGELRDRDRDALRVALKQMLG
jgi:mRNA interferase MazF